ncbi:MAG: glutaredoxin family protein [Brachybacterium tyrofermentans]|uniref:glutaredoxin family protein n=1 Tax=Brachybacterium tyrofermentans TaxID=47848 RepID=UPI000A1B20B1|nr:hypothetical protein [Brachybacterium tyrofermentans]SLM98468.1 putative integral membrane protein [Corynebacterium xerosis]
MDRRTLSSLAVGLGGVVVVAVVLGLEDLRAGVLTGVVGVVVVLGLTFWSARRGRHTPWPRAAEDLAAGCAVVLWKPGCVYCERLLLQIRSDPRVTWVNVWRDEQANAQVRAVNGGDELTPTVLLGEDVLRNPSAHELRAALNAAAAVERPGRR